MSETKVVQLLTSGNFPCYEEWRQVLPQQQEWGEQETSAADEPPCRRCRCSKGNV